MSDDKKQPLSDGLNFEEATSLTIEEAVQRQADLEAGIQPGDSVLDKYIKRNPQQISQHKFENKDKGGDFSSLDTSGLDKFIRNRRRELTETGTLTLNLFDDRPLGSDNPTIVIPSKPKSVTPPSQTPPAPKKPVAPAETFYGDKFTKSEKQTSKRKIWVILGLLALLLTSFGLAYGVNQLRTSAKKPQATSSTNKTASSTSQSSKLKAAPAADVTAFDDLYKTFFADEELTKPKNSEFANLASLEEALAKLSGTSDHAAAKTKLDNLKKAQAAIEAVNAKFVSPAIIDGEKVEASLKEGANFDDLTASVLNTGKASLDTLLQAVITEAKGLTPGGQLTGKPASEQAPEASTASSTTSQGTSQAAAGTSVAPPASEPAATSRPAVSGGTWATNYGISDYDPAKLQRQLSRVPYNADAIADSSNPAWSFNPGVIENIIRISQERGHITGYNFILEPVNIVNGNGYYNMFTPDGTYLFSINAKTGYFVGNAPGRADALDY